MQQQTFAEVSFERYRKPTRRERFLDEMNRVVPWTDLAATIAPVYPKAEGPGRPPVGVERMLRLHWSATVVQPVGSRGGGGALRLARAATIRGH